jgi:hypothetical protein
MGGGAGGPQPFILYAMTGLGREPVQLPACPYCHRPTVTIVKHEVEGVTVLAAAIVMLLFWPLFWLPLLVPACKASKHYCSECHRPLGRTEPCS